LLATTAGAAVRTPLPPNVRTADFLPFADALPLVDVVVSNGGWGGVLEALSHGIPLIVAGGDLDKPEIAARVAWSGAGIDLGTGHPSARKIARALGRITRDPGYRERARAIATELAALGGASRACELIEELLRTGEPVRRSTDPWS
jgi:UDP:flavonoid glycosyltransferase YjiC (YdhE family)